VKFSHMMATAVLMGGLLSGVAQAGVTGAEGGTKSVTEKTNTTIDRTDNVRDVEKFTKSTTTSATNAYKTINKTNNVYEYATQTHWASPTTVENHVYTTRTWIGGPGLKYGQAGGWGTGPAKPGRYVSHSTSTSYAGSGVQTLGSSSNTSFLGSSTASATQTAVKSVTDYLGRDRDFVNRVTDYNRDTTVTSNRSQNLGGAIVIGDLDALAGAWVAQGNVTQHTNINVHHDDTYDHTDTYLNTDNYHRTDNYTHTTTVTKTDRYKNTTSQTLQNVTYYTVNHVETISPIVLDLDGDGALEASNGQWLPHPASFDKTRVALFDFHANGFPMATEWVGPNDGLLVRPHEDGSVDGSCLFGSNRGYNDGFEALSGLDADNNGQVEGAELQGLMVWQDSNSNAVVDGGELLTLDGLGITALNVRHDNLKSTYTRNGKSFSSFDWWPSAMELRKKNMGKDA